MSTGVEVRRNVNATEKVEGATDRHMMDMAQRGHNAAQERILRYATDTGQLERSGFRPTRRADGAIEFGWAAEYAQYVNDGTEPHWVPIAELLGWARRVLGDESAAYAVQQKIAERGTGAVEFVDEALAAMGDYATTHGIDDVLEERL